MYNLLKYLRRDAINRVSTVWILTNNLGIPIQIYTN
jgi:hypothetical protein